MTKKELEDILKHTVCKKGCGEVEIENYGGGPICSYCGEELDYQLTDAHKNWVIKNIPVREEE